MPPDHEESNERLARETLLDRVPIPEEQIHPLRSRDVELPDRFELVLLGVGSDGHTASLYPGHEDELAESSPIVYVPDPGMPPPHSRLTFSLAYLNAQPCLYVLVRGEGKRDILGRILAGDESLPAARLAAAETVVFADEAAAPARSG